MSIYDETERLLRELSRIASVANAEDAAKLWDLRESFARVARRSRDGVSLAASAVEQALDIAPAGSTDAKIVAAVTQAVERLGKG